MGQKQTYPSLRIQKQSTKNKTSRSKKLESKQLKVYVDNREYQIEAPDSTLTCGWLISEVIRLSNNPSIVSLKTLSNLEIVDYWLTHFDRPLTPLRQSEKLTAVFCEQLQYDLCLDHFEPVKVVGKGGFSTVSQVRKKDTGMLYAIKTMDKHFIRKEEKVSQVLTERRIMIRARHPFIVKLHWAFQTQNKLHLVMDLCPGGELFFHLHNIGRFNEKQARFYFAEILLALEYLHQENVVYRDLKPENILLNIDGHIRITDFGLSKENITKEGRTFSFCGSPEYMSPEMLKGKGHGRLVDLYSLGALLYEMLTGLPPFYHKNRSKMYYRIMNEHLSIPEYLSKPCKDLLKGLLEKDPQARLGCTNGLEEIKNHVWCEKIPWDRIRDMTITPPFRPNLRVSNFDPEYTRMEVDPVFSEDNRTSVDDLFIDWAYYSEMEEGPGKQVPSDISLSTTISKSAGFISHNSTISREESKLHVTLPKISLTEIQNKKPRKPPQPLFKLTEEDILYSQENPDTL